VFAATARIFTLHILEMNVGQLVLLSKSTNSVEVPSAPGATLGQNHSVGLFNL
jgi:hypothetical protein